MADRELLGVATTAKLGGHPIYPMLVPFPIALLVATFISDLAFWGTGNLFWADTSFWLLAAGLVMGAAAAVAGFTDFFGNAQIRAIGDAWQHMIGNLIAVVLSLLSLIIRWGDPVAGVMPWGLVLSTVVVLILLFTGWKGGSLVYHHRVGMQPEAPAERHEVHLGKPVHH